MGPNYWEPPTIVGALYRLLLLLLPYTVLSATVPSATAIVPSTTVSFAQFAAFSIIVYQQPGASGGGYAVVFHGQIGCRVNRECITSSRSDTNNARDVFGNVFVFHDYENMPTTNLLQRIFWEDSCWKIPATLLHTAVEINGLSS